MKRLRFIYESRSIGGHEILARTIDVLRSWGCAPILCLSGKKVDVKSIEKKISRKESWPSGLSCGGFNLIFGLVPAWGQSFLVIQEAEIHDNIDLESKLEPLLDVNGLIQAWIVDVDYDYWQNAKDTLQYESVGRSFSGLPMKSNGLPPPLERTVIDTSNNPGRSEYRQGYIEAIGSTMWLGSAFWGKTGVDRSHSLSLLQNAGVEVHSYGNVDKIVASEDVFQDESTSEMQTFLRASLFGVP